MSSQTGTSPEEDLVSVLESITDGFIRMDAEWRHVYVNAAAERMLKKPREEILGKAFYEAFPEVKGTEIDRQVRRAAADRKPAEFETLHEPWGRWFDVKVYPANDGTLSVYFRDVTERRREQQELDRSRRELLDFFENAIEGMQWVGPDGTILWANRAALEMLGFTAEEYVGRSAQEFQVDAGTFEDLLTHLASGAPVANREARLRRKDGSIRDVLVNSNALMYESRLIHTRWFMHDITKRKEAERRLQASERRFTRYMENLPGLAWMKDLEGRYLYVNGVAARAFNHSIGRIIGHTDWELFPEETAKQFRANDDRGLQDGGVLVIERLKQDDEVEHHSLVSKFPVADEDGDIVAVGGVAIDITERIQAEEALKLADRRKDEYVAMLAHELRNPLSPIVTATEILRLRSGGDAMIERQRDIIQRQVGQMRRLLDDLLDVSRISRGKVQITREPMELANVLKHAVETSRPQIEAARHTLEVELPGEPLPVSGDAARLAQVFTNLLNNAAKFTQPGGHIWLEANRDGDQARVAVRDTGIGMRPELLAEAFELFRQGSSAADRTTSGLGIGLTLVRQLVESHEGTVTALSAGHGAGSEFIVLLPLLRREYDQAE